MFVLKRGFNVPVRHLFKTNLIGFEPFAWGRDHSFARKAPVGFYLTGAFLCKIGNIFKLRRETISSFTFFYQCGSHSAVCGITRKPR